MYVIFKDVFYQVDIQLAHPRLPKNPSTGKLSGQTVPLFQNNQNDFTNYFQNIIKSYADVYGPQAAAALSQYYEQYYTQYMSTYYNNMYGSTLGQQQQNIPSNNRDYSVGAISSDTTRRNRSKSPNRVKDPRYQIIAFEIKFGTLRKRLKPLCSFMR